MPFFFQSPPPPSPALLAISLDDGLLDKYVIEVYTTPSTPLFPDLNYVSNLMTHFLSNLLNYAPDAFIIEQLNDLNLRFTIKDGTFTHASQVNLDAFCVAFQECVLDEGQQAEANTRGVYSGHR